MNDMMISNMGPTVFKCWKSSHLVGRAFWSKHNHQFLFFDSLLTTYSAITTSLMNLWDCVTFRDLLFVHVVSPVIDYTRAPIILNSISKFFVSNPISNGHNYNKGSD